MTSLEFLAVSQSMTFKHEHTNLIIVSPLCQVLISRYRSDQIHLFSPKRATSLPESSHSQRHQELCSMTSKHVELSEFCAVQEVGRSDLICFVPRLRTALELNAERRRERLTKQIKFHKE